MSRAELILDIVNNTSAHIVNREEKMNRTLDVMCSNISKKQAQLERFHNELSNHSDYDGSLARGYGKRTGRSTGD